MSMKNPVHPGRIVKMDCLAPLNLTVTRAAGILGGSRQALNNVINEKAGISAEMAIRLEKGFWRDRRNMAGDANQLRPCTSPPA
jgi:antitoxin HigA-1